MFTVENFENTFRKTKIKNKKRKHAVSNDHCTLKFINILLLTWGCFILVSNIRHVISKSNAQIFLHSIP